MQVLWFGAGPSGGLQVTSGLVLGLYGVSTVELLLLKGRRVQFSSLVFLPAGSLFLLLPLVLGIGGSSSLGFLRSVECRLVREAFDLGATAGRLHAKRSPLRLL